MSLPVPVKIKDEPLDPEYGDVIPKLSSSSEKNKNLDAEIRNDLNEFLKSTSFLDNDVQNSENNLSSVKIKTEKPDSPPPAQENVQAKVKTEPEDFPDDFFDCLNDNNFLDEIAKNNSDESNNDTSQLNKDSDSSKTKSINQTSIEKEIEKTEKIISKAKQKLVLKKSKKSHKDKQIKLESESEETSKGSEENHKKHHHSDKKRKSRSRERHHSRKSDRNEFEDGEINSDGGQIHRRRNRRSSSLESYSKRKRLPSRSISRSRSREKNRSSTKKRQRRSRSRSRSSSRPTSRERIRMRSLRSRSRSMSRSYSRSPSYSNSHRHRRSRSRSSCRDSSHSKSRKLSFLEELEKTFAKQGKSFPEKDLLSKMDIASEYLKAAKKAGYKHLMPVPKIIKTESTKNGTNDRSSSTPEKMDIDEIESQAQSPPPNPPEEEEITFPRPFIIKEEPQDDGYDRPCTSSSITNKPSTSTKTVTPLNPSTIKEEKLETIAQRRERVLNTCTEAIKKLHMYEKNESEAIFTYTPTIIQEKTIEEITKYRSPLNNIHNLQFKFNSSTPADINLKSYGLKSLPQKSAKLAQIIGIDALTIFEKLNHKDLPYSLKMLKKSTIEEKNKNDNDEKKSTDYKPFYTSVGVQTEPYSCGTCILRQLRKFHDVGVQSQPFCEDNYTQVDPLMLGMPIQQNQQHYQQQQQFYPPSIVPNVNQPQMMPPQTVMYNNYGPSYPPSGHSYYPTPSGQPISTNYGQPQPSQPQMMNMMPIQTSQHPIYPQVKSHPGPRSIPSTSSSSAINRRSHNIVLPTNRNN